MKYKVELYNCGQSLKVDKGNKSTIYFNGIKTEETINFPDENKSYLISYGPGEDIDYFLITSEDKTRKILYNSNKNVEYKIDTDIKNKTQKITQYNDDGEIIAIENKEYNEENENKEKESIEESNKNNMVGNHAVVAIDIKKDNVTLILDPTSRTIGYYNDGKINMFNERDKENSEFRKTIGTDVIINGIGSIASYTVDYAKSFLNPKLTYEELEEKYGVEAQNRTLEELEKNKKINFKNSLKVEEISKDVFDDSDNKEPNIVIKINDMDR